MNMEIMKAKMIIANAVSDDEMLCEMWSNFCTQMAIRKGI